MVIMDQYGNSIRELSQLKYKGDKIRALSQINSQTPDPKESVKAQVAAALKDLTTASQELMQAEQEL